MNKKFNGKQLLIIEIFYFKVQVSIVQKQKDNVKTLHLVKRQSIFPFEAVNNCLDELKAQKYKIPKHAICASTDVFGGVLTLKDKADNLGMQLQWELENNLINRIPAINQDQVLQAESFLSINQLEQLHVYENQHSIIAENYTERCLNGAIIDEDFVEEIQYFINQRPDFNSADNFDFKLYQEDKVRGNQYCCTASSYELKLELSTLLKDRKIDLLSTLPWTGLSIQDEVIKQEKHALYIEKHLSYWFCVLIRKSKITETKILAVQEDKSLPDELIELICIEDLEVLQYNGFGDQNEQVKAMCGQQTLFINSPQDGMQKALAAYCWQISTSFRPAGSNVIAPPIPLRERPSFWWALGIAASLIFCSTYTFDKLKKRDEIQKKVDSQEKNVKDKSNDNRTKINDFKKYKKLKTEIAKLKISEDNLSKKLRTSKPNQFAYDFLSQLAKTNLENMKILNLFVDNQGEFEIEGVAQNISTPYEFNSFMNKSSLKLSAQLQVNEYDEFYHFFLNSSKDKKNGR